MLNVEYLMAEFYACATTGSGLAAPLRLGGPPSIGCQKAALTGTLAVRLLLLLSSERRATGGFLLSAQTRAIVVASLLVSTWVAMTACDARTVEPVMLGRLGRHGSQAKAMPAALQPHACALPAMVAIT